MKARPILFSAPMVRALLDGRKTQTRRVVKPQPGSVKALGRAGALVAYRQEAPPPDMPSARYETPIRCPYGAPGDLLWVKESWRYINHQNGPRGFEVCVGYEADGEDLPNRPSLLTGPGWDDRVDSWPYRSRRWLSIHMPRWANRLTLEITEVRVERLQDISEADAIAEGASECANGWWFDAQPSLAGSDARGAYYCLWESIHGPGSWAANPWVWALTFTVHRANVDRAIAARAEAAA